MRGFLPTRPDFYVTIKTFVTEHLSRTVAKKGWNEGWSFLIRRMNLAHCHSLPPQSHLAARRGIYLSPVNYEKGARIAIKSIRTPAKKRERPPFPRFEYLELDYIYCHYFRNVLLDSVRGRPLRSLLPSDDSKYQKILDF